MPAASAFPPIDIERRGALVAARFEAMASPCEVLIETDDVRLARHLGTLAAAEAWRIERKYSRYRGDSVITRLNRSGGRPVALDPETRRLLDFAACCHAISGGAFDITSGVLRRAWRFDGGGGVPDARLIEQLRWQVGFERLTLADGQLTVPDGMELDLGGIGKEYAVDRALSLIQAGFKGAALVNFGGDLAAASPPRAGPWRVGVERPDAGGDARLLLELARGGLATSGDTHRFLMHEGRRYGHILDVRTGWPVRGAPRSVTVAAGSCVEAGLLATLAMLQGAGAEAFLARQEKPHWCLRS